MPASALLHSTVEEAMADKAEALERLPHLLETDVSLSAWTAVQPFITHALAPSRMQQVSLDKCYILENDKHFSLNNVCMAAHTAIELIAIGHSFQEHCGPDVLADNVPSIMAWTIFMIQHINDMLFSDASKLWESSSHANRRILMDLKCRALIYRDARCKEYLCNILDLWTHAGAMLGGKGIWFSIVSNLVSSWVPDPTDGSINAHGPADSLLAAAFEIVTSRVGAMAQQQIKILHIKDCGLHGTPESAVPIYLMYLLCRSREFRMALEARGGIRLLCKLLRRLALDFAPSRVDRSGIPGRIHVGMSLLSILKKMICGPAPVREALHCGSLLTVMLLWSHIETSIALRGAQDADRWLSITRRGASKYFSEGIESWLWFPSIHRVLQRSITEVEELMKDGLDIHEEPLAYFMTMRKWYHEHHATTESISRRCSRPECISQSRASLSPDTVKYCSGCLLVAYCSAECQREHWIQKHRQECFSLANASAAKSPRSPLSYIDRCALLHGLRSKIRQNIHSVPHETFIVVKISVNCFEFSHQSYAESASRIEAHGRAQYGDYFDEKAVLEKAIRMRLWGDGDVFVCVIMVPYTIVDVISVRNVVEGWVDPELRKWIVG
ncbi:hypothetical protein CYLTODRAFT_427112 [Cylindrobasidium torrendii FP15055 ss-10]|uniref:phytol kinase n=1 Tax=Cylindrobasidium torrendii FP15055 ss-10 TaxID=1314674 RepID=A0A0D7AY06_9AGAR|nr:hypothetical protein CYLTODRAFT_427112 [Cylindrobasidium torrendii FP15055 ss-10]